MSGSFAIGLDVGGTSLKSAIVISDGSILKDTFRKVPIDSQGTTESIIDTFIQALQPHLRRAEDLRLEVSGMGIGMPGPFDYERGVSLMNRKFGAIYGLNLRHALCGRLRLQGDFLIKFENDAWTFLRGEAWLGAARGYQRIIGLTLGTGLGSAFMVGNRLVSDGPGVPPYAWVGGMPYEDGIVEDKITRNWIISRYEELSRRKHRDLDVKAIAMRGAKYRDKASLQTFEEMGRRLGQVLRPIVSEFEAECLVLGGQISKSFPLFSNPLRKELQSVPTLRKITRARMINLSPIYGAAKTIWQV
jgi:glucokinase